MRCVRVADMILNDVTGFYPPPSWILSMDSHHSTPKCLGPAHIESRRDRGKFLKLYLAYVNENLSTFVTEFRLHKLNIV